MSKRDKYAPDYSKCYPGVEISPEVMRVLRQTDRQMQYFELDLKTERKRRKKQTVTVLPAREDSLDRLAENGGYPYTPADVSVEDALIERDELERLRCALRELRMDEWMLVNALYYQGISETEAAKILNVTQQAVSYRIKAICRKLKKIMEK